MTSFIDRLLTAARKYTVSDFAFLKLTLFTFGVLLATYFHDFFRNWVALVWVVFAVSYLWVMYKTFFRYLR